MSEVVTEPKVSEKNDDKPEVKDELVSKSVVEDYKKDLFKFKDKFRDSEVELQKLKDQIALGEKQTLEDNAEWKVLYEKEKEEKIKALGDLESKSKFFIETSIKNNVIQRLGGLKKDSYASFIDTSTIDINEDGTFNNEAILAEVDRIKQSFPELLNVTTGKMPNEAAIHMGKPQNRNLSTLSSSELLALYSKVKT